MGASREYHRVVVANKYPEGRTRERQLDDKGAPHPNALVARRAAEQASFEENFLATLASLMEKPR